MSKYIIFGLLLLSGNLHAEDSLAKLVDEHYKIIRDSNAMFEYSLDVSNLIWVKWALVEKCAPEGVNEVSDFLYEINASGELTNTWHFPKTEVSVCVENHLRNSILPKPISRYIGLENIQSGS